MANLIPWDALDDLAQFFEALEEFFEDQTTGHNFFTKSFGLPQLEMQEDEEKVTFCFLVPEDLLNQLKVRVDGNTVEIFGEVGSKIADKREGSTEASWKSVYQSFNLPQKLAGEKAQVTLKGNNLIIEIPRDS